MTDIIAAHAELQERFVELERQLSESKLKRRITMTWPEAVVLSVAFICLAFVIWAFLR